MYQVHELAELAGVTTKALRHYDRIGLLVPKRTAAGYRVYSDQDLERLKQIVALKFLGLSLRQITRWLHRPAADLLGSLRLQREILESRKHLLTRAIEAIRAAESAGKSGEAIGTSALRRIIEVIDMTDGVDQMQRYFSGEAWQRCRAYYEQWPSPDWRDLYRDIEDAHVDGPASPRAQSLARRWMQLVESESGGDWEARWGMFAAWRDRRYWPLPMLDRMAGFRMDEIWAFAGSAIISARNRYYSDADWAETAGFDRDEPGYGLIFETMAHLGDDAAAEKSQALAARWWKLNETSQRFGRFVGRWKELAAERHLDSNTAIRRQVALFNIEAVWGFIARASYAGCR